MGVLDPANASGPASAISKYAPILELGRGGMATVHLCVLRGLGGFSKLQVVKRLRAGLAEDPEFRAMFLEEARLAARLSHPNIVQTNEVGTDGANIFIAMEYLEGQSFEHLLRQADKARKPLKLRVVLPILMGALQGLAYAHRLKDFRGLPLRIVHRDVSPHNVFVTYDGQVKVVDFGIAKAADSSQETRTGVIKGKVAYMAPEQVTDRKNVDGRADVFAIGAILWRVLTGKRLWRGLNDVEILMALTRGEIPSPAAEKPELDPGIVAICMKALSADRLGRYQSAEEMLSALEAYLPKVGGAARPAEIGALLKELFEADRVKVARAVEQRMTNLDEVTWEQMEDVAPSSHSFTPSHVSTGGLHTMRSAASGSQFVEEPEGATLVQSPSRPKRWWRLAIGAVALLGAAAGAFAYVRHRPVRGAPLPVAAPEHAVASASSAPSSALEASVDLRITVEPAGAAIFVDDAPLSSRARYPRDGAMHRVRAEAQGYEAEAQMVSFAAPIVALDFHLNKVAAHATRRETAHPAPKVRSVPAASTAPEIATPPTPPPTATASEHKLDIDKSKPW